MLRTARSLIPWGIALFPTLVQAAAAVVESPAASAATVVANGATSAAADVGAPAITPLTAAVATVTPSGSVALATQIPVGSWARFEALDGGAFANGQSVMAVQADAAGRAEVAYHPLPGVTGTVQVIATCSASTDRAVFRIEVKP